MATLLARKTLVDRLPADIRSAFSRLPTSVTLSLDAPIYKGPNGMLWYIWDDPALGPDDLAAIAILFTHGREFKGNNTLLAEFVDSHREDWNAEGDENPWEAAWNAHGAPQAVYATGSIPDNFEPVVN
jgi:hypothetical protein